MNNTSSYESKPSAPWLDRKARSIVLKKLANLVHGRIAIHDGDDTISFGTPDDVCPVDAAITVHSPRFYSDVLFGGSIGAAESYMAGGWTSEDLTNVIRVMTRNRAVLETVESGMAWLSTPVRRGLHWLNRNTRSGSRKNITAHYDLGNEFFALFLDPTMMYSAAVFDHEYYTLEEASRAKLDRICKKLDLQPADHVLEVGTGWGGFALHAAQHYGCHITTTTISDEQYALATKRVADAGLQDTITVLKEDYRDISGLFNKVVSIEMIEAVGYRYYDTYFNALNRRLAPDGMLLIQAIIIDDRVYDSAIKSVDFIQRYIFPGSCIPSITAIINAVKRASDMRLFHCEDITRYYVRTLQEWRKNFTHNAERIKELGYPDEFMRMWEFYLCYCEGGFAERAIGDVQMLFTKPLCRRSPILGVLA